MDTTLTDQDRADLARFLREAIEADRFPLWPRVRRLKELLTMLEALAGDDRNVSPAIRTR
jgi:hypothetical protein